MRYTNKQILKITYPVLISLLMEHMIGLTDTAYLGRVGEVELGASALAGVYYLVIYMLGFGFSVGAQVLMARRNGEGEYERIGEVFTQGGLFLFLLAAVLFTASNLLTPHLLHRMIGSEEVYRATMSYLDWPFCAKRRQTVLLPLPMPPVIPTFIIPVRRENLSREPRR